MPVEKQIAILYCGTNGLLADVALEKVSEFEKLFLETLEMRYQKEVFDVLIKGVIDEKVTEILTSVAKQVQTMLK
jgi:F-type H+-transporting ATPase subunit alpha